MKLTLASLEHKEFFTDNNILVPKFNYKAVASATEQNPCWVHFGAGNIFRGFIARAHQAVLDAELCTSGIVAVETFDTEIIDRIYKPCDNLTLLATMAKDGSLEKSVIASIVESLTLRDSDALRLATILENPSLQMISFTITEKGYSLTDSGGEYLPVVLQDFEDFDNPKHTMSLIARLLYKRFLKGAYPVSVVSMDNCSHNGDLLRSAVLKVATEWVNRSFISKDFLDYLQDDTTVAFPLTMIDKITPRPSKGVQDKLEILGFEDLDIVVTEKHTYIAPFVNAEVCEYLVVEDKFPNGRPQLEEGGVIFTDRETVNRVETMKVTTCLNPLHTALAVTGCVFGYTSIAAEMQDPLLAKLVHRIADEGLQVVVDPKIINPKEFVQEVIDERFSNPNIPDTPQRIATDTSLKVGIRFGETIKKYMASNTYHTKDLLGIPLAIASWLRYLLGVDVNGNSFELSPDPQLESLQEVVSSISIGDTTCNIRPILENKEIFGVDLYEAQLGDTIELYFRDMLLSHDGIKKVFHKYLG